MSKGWNARSEAERKAAEAAFVARYGAELLLDGDEEHEHSTDEETVPARCPLLFANLYAVLQRPGPLPAKVSAALHDDARLRDDFAVLLERHAHRHVPRAAAAAGRGALHRREVEGFTIRVVESRARSDQVYLLIELPESVLRSVTEPDGQRTGGGSEADPVPEPDTATAPAPERNDTPADGARGSTRPDPRAATPAQLVVKTAEEEFLKRELPAPDARTIRLVMAADDPLVQAVGEPESEIYLL